MSFYPSVPGPIGGGSGVDSLLMAAANIGGVSGAGGGGGGGGVPSRVTERFRAPFRPALPALDFLADVFLPPPLPAPPLRPPDFFAVDPRREDLFAVVFFRVALRALDFRADDFLAEFRRVDDLRADDFRVDLRDAGFRRGDFFAALRFLPAFRADFFRPPFLAAIGISPH